MLGHWVSPAGWSVAGQTGWSRRSSLQARRRGFVGFFLAMADFFFARDGFFGSNLWTVAGREASPSLSFDGP
ncbi:hypothetical protein ABTM18_19815, partial [Acinetobacter baumannii]